MEKSLNLTSLKNKIASKIKASNEKNATKTKSKKEKKPNDKEKNPIEKSDKSNKFNNEKSDKSIKLNNKKTSKSNQLVKTQKQKKSKTKVDDVLRKEALELGATEEDLKLIENVNEDENEDEVLEVEDGGKDINTKDVESFIKSIGLNGELVIDDDAEDEKEEDVEEEEEKEEEKGKEGKEEDKASSTKSQKEKVEPSQSKTKEEPKIKQLDFNNSNLTLPSRVDWYNILEELETPKSPSIPLNNQQIENLFTKAETLIKEENRKYYESFSQKSSQKKFFSDILINGTLNDKISALTLMIQESPIHNLKSFETLMVFCDKKSRNASLQSINSLKDLLINGVLPKNRKLKYFKNQTLDNKISDEILILYYFEDFLKKKVFQLLTIFEKLSHDSILFVRMNCLTYIFDLLTHCPEQEQNLLNLGINKLGDLDHKVCAKSSFLILKLQENHPLMKSIIINNLIDFVNKNYENYNTRYYGILTLNQTILIKKEIELANNLVTAYFLIFKRILKDDEIKDESVDVIGKIGSKQPSRKNLKKGKNGGISVKEKTSDEIKKEKNSKLFSAVLSGLNRAFPFSNLPNEIYLEHLNSLFLIVHNSNFTTTIQALSLINHIVTSQNLDNSRFYKTLYESLLDERLIDSSKQGLYLNLLFKSLKNDKDHFRILAFVKRILQVCFNWINIGAICGMLFLLIELVKYQPVIKSLLIEDLSIEEKEEEEGEEEKEEKDKTYDLMKRDPRFANADKTSFWELIQFLNHYHPTVQLYAQGLLSSLNIVNTELIKPDLGLYTLSHFLDKFVYKNPKQKVHKGSSIMQPLSGVQTGSLLMKSRTNEEMPINLKTWVEENINPDEKFFHEFFKNKPIKTNDDELSEDEVWKALVASNPDIDLSEDGFSDEDIDLNEEDFSDLSEEEIEDDKDDDEQSEYGEIDEDLAKEFEKELDALSDEEIKGDDELSEGEDDFTHFSSEDDSNDELHDIFNKDLEDEITSDEEVSKKRSKNSNKSNKRSKIKDLPVFASADEYSKYLESDDEY